MSGQAYDAASLDVWRCTTHTPQRMKTTPMISITPTVSFKMRAESDTAATGVRLPNTDARDGPVQASRIAQQRQRRRAASFGPSKGVGPVAASRPEVSSSSR